jgi:hypothetical protein
MVMVRWCNGIAVDLGYEYWAVVRAVEEALVA